MSKPLDTIQYKHYAIEIYSDDDSESPRNWDNLGKMLCLHRRYNLGDEHNYDADEILEIVQQKDVIALPLFLYDHSGISMSAESFIGRANHAEWDSGQVGFIYVDYETIRKNYGWKFITKARKNKIIKYLLGEVEIYDDYLRGDVFGYNAIRPDDDEEIDSCWGFYGYNHKESGLLEQVQSAIDYDIQQREEKAYNNLAMADMVYA